MNKGNTDQIRSVQVQSSRKWIMTTAIVLATLMLGSLIFLAVSGRIAVAFGANRQAIVRTVACTDDIVSKYNDISARSAAAQADSDLEGFTQEFSSLAEDIVGKAGYAEDATCQYILFLTYQHKGDTANMKKAAGAIIALHESKQFINNEVGQQVYSIAEFKEVLGYDASE